jgi:hypothetical protein
LTEADNRKEETDLAEIIAGLTKEALFIIVTRILLPDDASERSNGMIGG